MYNFLNLLMAVFKEINTFTYPKMKKKLKMKKLFLSRSPQKVKEIKTTNFGSKFIFKIHRLINLNL